MAGDVELGIRIAREIVAAGASATEPDEMLGRPADAISERARQLLV
jgi:hypothetical protein